MATDLSNLDKFLKCDSTASESENMIKSCNYNIDEILTKAKEKGIKTIPLDIRKVVSNIFDIEIIETDLGREVSGFLERINMSWKIYINRYESESRKRFTIAHELGHFVYHRDKYSSGSVSTPDQIFFRDENVLSPIEQEANNFAANLLMPEDVFKKYIDSGVRKIVDLADRFQLSTSAIKYRAYKLGMLSEYK